MLTSIFVSRFFAHKKIKMIWKLFYLSLCKTSAKLLLTFFDEQRKNEFSTAIELGGGDFQLKYNKLKTSIFENY